jgi:hypothetical protein
MTLNLCSLPIGQRLRTRDGRSARLLATDLKDSGGLPIVVAVTEADHEYIDILHASGRRCECCPDHPEDIVSVEPINA